MRLRVLVKLRFALVAERWLGIPFVLQGVGLARHPVPWSWLEVEVNTVEVVWLIHTCAELGARTDLLFLNGMLEKMLA
jgi:hypothetical protein